MIAIILAGGYAKRLQPICIDTAKPLLRVVDKPIIGYLFDKVKEIDDIRSVVISTNLRFQEQFREWLRSNPERRAEIIADASYFDEEKPGAIASLAQITSTISDDCLIIAGDNLFTSSLRPMFRAFRERSSTVVALYDVKDLELAKHYSTVTLDSDGRMISLDEKPSKPETTLTGTCIYMLPKRVLPRLKEYVAEAGDRDSLGRFIGWLCRREPVYGFVLGGRWWDMGTADRYYGVNQALYVERVLSQVLLENHRPTYRRFKELVPVLYDPASCRDIHPEQPVYEVYRGLCGEDDRQMLLERGLRYDVTIMPPMMLGEEYVKTLGHDHLPYAEDWGPPEVFEILEGEARFLIQKYQGREIVDVSLVKAKTGDKVLVPPNCGHVMINAFSRRLVVGNLISRFCLQTYRRFVEQRGAAYYLLKSNRLVRNLSYTSAPDVRTLDSDVLPLVDQHSGLLSSFLSNQERFAFLNQPSGFSVAEVEEKARRTTVDRSPEKLDKRF